MTQSRLIRVVVALAGAAGIVYAARIAWVCDDAFISFRYALHLARGQGLVFNTGEYVEGYTNFLWTVLIAPFIGAGLDPVIPSEILGIASLAALLFLLHRLGGVVLDHGKRGWVPGAALTGLAAHYHMLVFATSGLETMLFTLLATAGSLMVLRALERGPENDRGAVLGMLLLTLSVMTRPDGFVFYGVAAVFLLAGNLRSGTPLLSARNVIPHAPFAVLLIPFLCWKLFYYGTIIPNTFYAKSAYSPYGGQGLLYVGLYFLSYWPFLLMLPAAIFLFVRRREDMGPSLGSLAPVHGVVLFTAWILYVVWVGGDFMFARFLIPITPFLLLHLERLLLQVCARLRPAFVHQFSTLMVLLLPVLMLLRWDPFGTPGTVHLSGITEENRIYSPRRMAQARSVALDIKPTIRRVDPPVAFVGAQAWLIYYLDVSTAIEAETGLTDAFIARRHLSVRGKIGHEKAAPMDYLKKRGVIWIFRPPADPSADALKIDGLPGTFEIVQHDARVLREITRDPRFQIVAGAAGGSPR